MTKIPPMPLSFAPPQVWQKSRRVLGVVLAVVILAPVLLITKLEEMPAEAAKLHALPVQIPLVITGVLLPILAVWLVGLCFYGAEKLRFEIADGQLIVHTMLRQYTMPLAGVTARRTPAKLSLRLAGTGLPGFYTGFYLLGDQRARVWATQRQGGVVLEGPKRWFVTPTDIDGFLAAAKAAGAQVHDSPIA